MATRTDALALPVLVVVAAVAMRGYLPGAQRAPREPAADNPFALFVAIGLLVAAVAIVVMAVVVRARHRTAGRAAAASRLDWRRDSVGWPTWRVALIVFGFVVAALLAAMLVSWLGGRVGLSPPDFVPPDNPESTTATPGSDQVPPASPEAPRTDSNLIGYFYVATGFFLIVLVAGSMVAMRRPPPPAGSETDADSRPATPDRSETLARAAEVGLAEVENLGREPRRAIIACYAAMERELAHVPDAVPQDFDTATEVLARAVDHHALRPDSATHLVDLFDEARFSPHVMNEGHRELAVQVLQRVLVELQGRT
jgi:Domain of unknown function (DUF4129)